MISSSASIEIAVKATKAGTFDVVEKHRDYCPHLDRHLETGRLCAYVPDPHHAGDIRVLPRARAGVTS